MQGPQVHAVAVVPAAVAVVVGHPRPRRIVIAVDGLDDPIGVRHADHHVGRLEQAGHFLARQVRDAGSPRQPGNGSLMYVTMMFEGWARTSRSISSA